MAGGSWGDWRNGLFLMNMGDIRADMINTTGVLNVAWLPWWT
jgi:hypothetical protein